MSKPNHFSALPAELRLEIYKHVLSSFTFDHEVLIVREPGILRTSRLLRVEATPVYITRLDAIVQEREGISDHAGRIVEEIVAEDTGNPWILDRARRTRLFGALRE